MVGAFNGRARRSRCRGFFLAEAVIAIGALAVVMMAVATLHSQDRKACRANYVHAIAMEIVDGEMEALAAGEWKLYHAGTQEYHVRANAARNLPDGIFLLTIEDARISLSWQPAQDGYGGSVTREVQIQ